MDLARSIEAREQSLISLLSSKREGIDDATGKGNSTELLVEAELIRPYLPPGFHCTKGAVVCADEPSHQSPAIDRLIYDSARGAPLVLDPAHSILPIEITCAAIEITMRIDQRKLGQDLERMAAVREMRFHRYLQAVPGTRTGTNPVRVKKMGVRTFSIGLPQDFAWSPRQIAQQIHEAQATNPNMVVHGVYVLGLGFFEPEHWEPDAQRSREVRAWTGPDRLFRFISTFSISLNRWPKASPESVPQIEAYLDGVAGIHEF